MSATPTAALVEEAKRREKDLAMWTIDESWRRDSMYDLLQFFRRLIKAHEQAEAERDAQHAEVLRLTGERDEARRQLRASEEFLRVVTLERDHAQQVEVPDAFWKLDEAVARGFGLGCMLTNAQWRERDAAERAQRGLKLMQSCLKDEERRVSELTATRDLLLTENARLQQQLSRPDPVVHETPVDGVVPCCGQKLHDLKDGARVNEGPLVNCDRMRLLSRVGEVSSANLLLTAENERLQQEHNAYCRKLANDGLTVAGRLQRELDAVRAENDTLHYLHNGGH